MTDKNTTSEIGGCRVSSGGVRASIVQEALWMGSRIDGVTLYGLPWNGSRTPTVAFTVDGVSSDVARHLGDVGVFVMWRLYATKLLKYWI